MAHCAMDVPTLIVRYEDRDKFDQVTKYNDFTNPVYISKVFNSWLEKGRLGQSIHHFITQILN